MIPASQIPPSQKKSTLIKRPGKPSLLLTPKTPKGRLIIRRKPPAPPYKRPRALWHVA